jgi:hypothetical protein
MPACCIHSCEPGLHKTDAVTADLHLPVSLATLVPVCGVDLFNTCASKLAQSYCATGQNLHTLITEQRWLLPAELPA